MSETGIRIAAIPREIRVEHRLKLALVYRRQSSARQVADNFGSTIVQGELAELPLQWGWPAAQIRVMDDLGLSGRTSFNRRAFKEMLELIELGEVGLVLFQDFSRPSRNLLDAEEFLAKALRAKVLIYASGRLFDTATADLAELFGARVRWLLAWLDNESRVRNLGAAKDAKAKGGHAVTRPPRGYVVTVRGQWGKDPDAEVCAAIARIWELYVRLGSIRKVAAYHYEHNLNFPTRERGAIRWGPVSPMQILHVLSNPLYTGYLVFRRLRVQSGTETEPRLVERVPESDWIFAKDVHGNPCLHHDPYVSWEEWKRIQTLLAERRVKRHPVIGNGPALLQGRLWCSRCERHIRTLYQMRVKGRRLPSYVCRPANRTGQLLRCFSVSSAFLDSVVVGDVLASLPQLDPPSIQAVMDDAANADTSIHTAHERELLRLKADVAKARQRYEQIQDPSHARVKLLFEAEFDAAVQQLEAFERTLAHLPGRSSATLSRDDAVELADCAREIEVVWSAQTTTNEDRKRILHAMISRISVVHASSEWIDLEIEWASGEVEARRLARPGGVRQLMADLQELPPPEIVQRLRDDGVVSCHGAPITLNVVRRNLRMLKSSAPGDTMTTAHEE